MHSQPVIIRPKYILEQCILLSTTMSKMQDQPFGPRQTQSVLAPLQLCFPEIALRASNIPQPSIWLNVVYPLLQVEHFKHEM